MHGHYVSPATASLSYMVSLALGTGLSSGESDISSTNPNCTATGIIGYLSCSIDIPASRRRCRAGILVDSARRLASIAQREMFKGLENLLRSKQRS
jgi:hypothetical protein